MFLDVFYDLICCEEDDVNLYDGEKKIVFMEAERYVYVIGVIRRLVFSGI